MVPMDVNTDGYMDLVYAKFPEFEEWLRPPEDRPPFEIRVLLNAGHPAPGLRPEPAYDKLVTRLSAQHWSLFLDDFLFGMPINYNLDGRMDLLLKAIKADIASDRMENKFATWHVLMKDGRGGFLPEPVDTRVSMSDLPYANDLQGDCCR